MKTNYKVLVVDDIERNLQVVGNILGEEKIAILFAKNGFQAIRVAQKRRPDLILLDINMPEMSGYEVCEILKKDAQTKDIPVIFLSALNAKENIVKGFDYGGVDYITKPFNKAELLSRVFTHLDLKKSRDTIAAQNEILTKQKVKIEEQHKKILSSINYAQVIQNAVLPSTDFLNQFIPENFIVHIPRDIVSGDFYWITQVGNQVVIAAGDCTGHGVPGAFMSMLGIAYLSEIFYTLSFAPEIKADTVLNKLRKRIKIALHQDNPRDNVSDGMDMALCIINLETREMNYAGANIPLFLVRFNETTRQNELLEYKPDRMPVAIHVKERPFTSHVIKLKTNDLIYLASDGYADQFGGKNNSKLKKKGFKNLLLKNSHKNMPEQKELLLNAFTEWKATCRQVDDVMVIGLKVSEIYGDVDMF